MIAFTCEYKSGEIKVDGNEIIDASWYIVDELPENIALKGTIARKLIDWCINEYK